MPSGCLVSSSDSTTMGGRLQHTTRGSTAQQFQAHHSTGIMAACSAQEQHARGSIKMLQSVSLSMAVPLLTVFADNGSTNIQTQRQAPVTHPAALRSLKISSMACSSPTATAESTRGVALLQPLRLGPRRTRHTTAHRSTSSRAGPVPHDLPAPRAQ